MSRRSASEAGREPNGAPSTTGSTAGARVASPRIHLNRLGEWARLNARGSALRRAARAGLAAGAGGPGGRPGPEEVSITLVTEEEIRDLNRRYLDRDATTDVLAFDLGSHGDVYISPRAAERAAAERGIPVAEELARLVVHAALHLTGHDHPEDGSREGSPMFRLQEEIVAELV